MRLVTQCMDCGSDIELHEDRFATDKEGHILCVECADKRVDVTLVTAEVRR